jgi:hypothetical protein
MGVARPVHDVSHVGHLGLEPPVFENAVAIAAQLAPAGIALYGLAHRGAAPEVSEANVTHILGAPLIAY